MICPECNKEMPILEKGEQEVYFCPFCGYEAPTESSSSHEAPKIMTIDAEELRNLDIREPEYLIDKLIVKNAVHLIASPMRSYKTFTALAMAFSLANGIDFLGFRTRKSKVLYLDCESPLELAKKRQYMIEKGLQREVEKDNLKYMIGERLDLNSEEGIDKLKFIIKENEAEVVVVDILRGFLENIKESSADDIREWFQTRIKPLKDELGITLIFIMHTRKSRPEDSTYEKWEKIRGSSELVNLSDLILMLDRRGFENFAELVCQKNRYGLEAEAFGIVYNFDDSEKELRMEKVDRDTWILSQTKYYTSIVLSYLISREKTSFQTKEVKEFLNKQNIKSVNAVANRVLEDLLNVGKIRKIKRGLWEVITEKQTILQ